MPVAASHAWITSGFNGSPALTQCRKAENLYFARSSRMTRRKAVGGAHQTCTGYLESTRNAEAASNFPRASTENTQAPTCHGPNRLDHAAFAQPVSDMFQKISPGWRSSQRRP